MTAPTKLAYTLTTAAEAYEVSVSHLTRAIHSGQLVAKRVGRGYRIEAAALREWFENLPNA